MDLPFSAGVQASVSVEWGNIWRTAISTSLLLWNWLNNRCVYQSITPRYLKRCLIKDELNYMFRPNVAIIRFTSESIMILLYRIGMDMSRWWDLSICDVCYMLFIGVTGGRICNLRYPGCTALVCLLAAVLCRSPSTVCPYPMSTAGELLLWVLWSGE